MHKSQFKIAKVDERYGFSILAVHLIKLRHSVVLHLVDQRVRFLCYVGSIKASISSENEVCCAVEI